MIVRTSDFTITPCGQLRDSGGCVHPECYDPGVDFGAQGEVVDISFDAREYAVIEFDWGYSIVVLPTTTVKIL